MNPLNLLPICLLVGVLFFSGCNTPRNEKEKRIEVLEKKISQLENGKVATPFNFQRLNELNSTNLGSFQFEEV